MPTSTRRRVVLASGALAAALAGCSGGSDDAGAEGGTAGGTETGTETPGMQVSGGDATFTLSLSSGANSFVGDLSEFDTLTVDIDRIVLLGSEDTDDATIQLHDTGLDLTTLPDDEKTYFEKQPFPGGDYTDAEIYLTVREATLSEGGDVTYDGESPVTVELGISEKYLAIESGSIQTLTLSVDPTLGRDSEGFTFSTGYSASSRG